MSSTPTQMASLAVLISLVCAALASDAAAAVRVDLTRVHADPSATASQFVRDALRRDMHRRHNARQLAAAAASNGTVSAPVQQSPTAGEYLMTLAIGTPPTSYQAIADTGSDLIWTQCAPCSSQCFKQPTPLYNPSSSTTFAVLPCNSSLSLCAAALAGAGATPPPGCACMYNMTYGSGWTFIFQGSETFTFGSAGEAARVPGITFGCSNASAGFSTSSAAGLVGLGRGPLSLVSQLGVPKFSYCLTPPFVEDANSTSTLLLGASASLISNDSTTGGGDVSSTPFVANPSGAPMSTYYYLNLTGVSLGATALPIPAAALSLNADGTGGFIIDSGTTITVLGNTAYQQVRAAVVALVTPTLPTADAASAAATGLDLCFQLPSSSASAVPLAMPSMTLHFDGADMVLPPESYMMLDGNLWCLAMQNQTDGEVSILGNYQQQDMHILYDVGQETLSFAPAKCSAF